MHANSAVGTVQPIAETARLTRERRILLHTDAAPSAGKLPLHVDVLGQDELVVAGGLGPCECVLAAAPRDGATARG